MQNNVNSNIQYMYLDMKDHAITSLGKILQFKKIYVQNTW